MRAAVREKLGASKWIPSKPYRRGTPEERSFAAARARCTNLNHREWKHYGGRGIEFRFSSFEQFIGHIGPRPAGMSLDRIDNDGHYELGNVRWATASQQVRNRTPSERSVNPYVRLRALERKQAAMRSKQPTRPWHWAKKDEAEASTLRLHKMFEAGLSDRRMADVTGMTLKAVEFLREATGHGRQAVRRQ
jgi:hypothetical protein